MPSLTPEQHADLVSWNAARSALAYWKAEESRLRLACVKHLGSQGIERGTERIGLESRWTAKIGYTQNYKVDEEAMWKLLEMGLPQDSFAALFKRSYDISQSAYNALTDEQRAWISDAVTIKPGMPTLELIPPDEDKIL